MKKAKRIRHIIFKSMVLIAYVACATTIVVESCMAGNDSAKQSNSVGQSLGGIINNFSKDQTKYVPVADVAVKNKPIETDILYVGDTYQVETDVFPQKATNQSLTYESSNLDVATIDDTGLITFLESGTSKITVTSDDNNKITDHFEVLVNDVIATDINVKIDNAIYNETDEFYTIYLGHSYPIFVDVLPDNTTDKSYEYEYNSSSISIQEDTITALSYNQLQPISITVKSTVDDTVKKEFKVVVDFDEITEPTSMEFNEGSSSSLLIGQTKKLTIKYLPENVSFTRANYTSSNINVATVDSTGKIKTVGVGTTTITATNARNNSFKATHELTVNPLPNVTGIKVTSTINNLVIDSTKIITITPVPSNAKIDMKLASFISNNPAIATVTNTGRVKGISEGSASISVTYNNKFNATVKVNVIRKTETNVVNISVKNKKNSIYKGETIAVNDLVDIQVTSNNNALNIANEEFEFEPLISSQVSSSLYNPDDYDGMEFDTNEMVTFNETNKTITAKNNEGFAFFRVYHVASGKYANFKFEIQERLPEDLSILYNNKPVEDNMVSIYVPSLMQSNHLGKGQLHYLSLQFVDKNATFKEYEWSMKTIEGSNVLRYEKREEENSVTLYPISEGIVEIKATITSPILKSTTSTSLIVNVSHNDLEEMSLLDLTTSTPQLINDELIVYKSQLVELGVTSTKTYSRALFKWSSSNPKVAKVNSHGIINTIESGTTKITVTNLYGDKATKSFTLTVINHLGFNESKPYELTGISIKAVAKDTYEMTNGTKAKIKINYADNVTYTKVSYKSSNEKILKVGKDGIIIPLKVGKAKVTITYDDGISVAKPLTQTITINIKKLPLITDFSSFVFYVRKGLGHFGVFFLLAIVSLLTYFLFFDKDRRYIGIIFHFIIGYLLALGTEIIQATVPGRVGKYTDVDIDFSGFMIGTAIFFIVYLIKYFVSFIHKKIKQKKEAKLLVNKNE